MKRRETRQREQALAGWKATAGRAWMLATLVRVIRSGKLALDAVMLEMGRMVEESVMLMERERVARPDYPGFRRRDELWLSPQSLIGLDDVVEGGLFLILPALLEGGEVMLDGRLGE